LGKEKKSLPSYQMLRGGTKPAEAQRGSEQGKGQRLNWNSRGGGGPECQAPGEKKSIFSGPFGKALGGCISFKGMREGFKPDFTEAYPARPRIVKFCKKRKERSGKEGNAQCKKISSVIMEGKNEEWANDKEKRGGTVIDEGKFSGGRGTVFWTKKNGESGVGFNKGGKKVGGGIKWVPELKRGGNRRNGIPVSVRNLDARAGETVKWLTEKVSEYKLRWG